MAEENTYDVTLYCVNCGGTKLKHTFKKGEAFKEKDCNVCGVSGSLRLHQDRS